MSRALDIKDFDLLDVLIEANKSNTFYLRELDEFGHGTIVSAKLESWKFDQFQNTIFSFSYTNSHSWVYTKRKGADYGTLWSVNKEDIEYDLDLNSK